MNNKIAVALFLFLLTQAAPASEIKAMIGINTSKYLFSEEITQIEHQQKTALSGGLGISFQLKDRIIIEINGIYNTGGAKTQISYAPDIQLSGLYRNTNFAFPIILKYRFLPLSTPYLGIGPEFIYVLSHDLEIPEMEEKHNLLDNTRRFNMGLTLVAGYEYKIKSLLLFAELRFNHEFTNLLKNMPESIKRESWAFYIGLAVKNHAD